MKNFLYLATSFKCLDDLCTDLEKLGLSDIYVIEDAEDKSTLIGGRAYEKINHPCLELKNDNVQLDWNDQWENFAENFQNGLAHIDLTPWGSKKEVRLAPGAGFGDLSHPTTNLMIELMHDKVKNRKVLDIGSGSGVLSFCAVSLGAKSAHGIDIDSQAIDHANLNAKLNRQLTKTSFSKSLPKRFGTKSLCLMNMILPEQKIFNPTKLNPIADLWITSGILLEQKSEYLKLAENFGWTLLEIREKQGWLGFIFQTQTNHSSYR